MIFIRKTMVLPLQVVFMQCGVYYNKTM